MLWTNGRESSGSRGAWVALALIAAALPLPAQEGAEAPKQKKWAAAVSRLAQPLIDHRIVPSLVIGFYDRGAIEVHGLGRCSADDPAPPDGSTIFEIGSITKVITAVLLAEAERRGEVEMTDPMGKWLPEGIPEPRFEGKSITLEHLATHRSALPRIPPGVSGVDLTDPYASFTREKLFEFIGSHELRREPGALYEYSNLGMGLLGQLLADRAGKSYPELLRERVVAPLGLVDTTVALGEEQGKRLAIPHRERQVVEPWEFASLCGCGGGRSTVDDLLRFMSATARALDPSAIGDEAGAAKKSAGLSASLRRVTEKRQVGMGLGWHIAADGSTLFHMGQTGGFSAGMLFNPQVGKGVVVLANGATAHVDRLAEQLIQTMFGLEVPNPEFPEEIEVAEEELGRLVGEYVSPFFTLTVTVREGALFAQITDQPAYRVYPKQPAESRRYFYRDLPAELEFTIREEASSEGGSAVATKVTLHQNGRAIPCLRR